MMKWRPLFIALSAILGVVSGMLGKCSTEPARTTTPIPTKTPDPTPIPTPIHTPTPQPPRILFEKAPVVGVPFKVRYTAQFKYNYSLWVDTFRLQTLGRESDTGYFVAPSVTLNSIGKRTFYIHDENGNVVSQEQIEVSDGSRIDAN